MNARIERYKHTRNWAVMVGPRLVCVCVYKRGAQEVADILNAVHSNLLALTLGVTPAVAAA